MDQLELAKVYDAPDLGMMFRVIDGPDGPGLITLRGLRALTKATLDDLDRRLDAIEAKPAPTNGIDGKNGLDGKPGTNGTNGTNGAPGAAGASAFQLAVAGGFVGTTADWIAALRGAPGKDGAGIRLESITDVAGTGGVKTITFAKPFTVAPKAYVAAGWVGNQMVTGGVVCTTTQAIVTLKRSKATLLLSDGPFEAAPTGTPFTIELMGY